VISEYEILMRRGLEQSWVRYILCLKKDEAFGLITLYIELDLVHHTIGKKSAKQIWDSFHTLFGTMNTIEVNGLEIELSNLKMVDFAIVEEYISRFKNLKVDILISSGKGKP
jgi:hypothetical protein